MHTGTDQVDLILQGLAGHAAHFTKPILAARLAVVGADGAGCAGGGPHPSTGAAEKLWMAVHSSIPSATVGLQALPVQTPAPMTDWDLFHRIDNGTSKAIRTRRAQWLFSMLPKL